MVTVCVEDRFLGRCGVDLVEDLVWPESLVW